MTLTVEHTCDEDFGDQRYVYIRFPLLIGAYLGGVGRWCRSRMWRLCQRGNSLKRKKRKKEQTLHKRTRVLTSCSAGRWDMGAAAKDSDVSGAVTDATASTPALGC